MPLPSLSDLAAVPSQRDVVLDAQRHVSADDLYTWYENNHGFPAGSGNDIVHSGWYNLMKILADSGGSMEYSNTNVLQAAGTNGITLDSTETINDIIEFMCNPPNVDQLTLQQLCKVLAEAIHNVLKISGYKNAYYQKRLSMYDDFPPEFGFPAAEVLTTKRFKPKHRKQLMKAKLAATRVRGPVDKEPDYYLYEAQVEGNAAQGGAQIRSSLV